MNQTDRNFEQIKQLLKLKRHEVPPPGYFNNFSGQVISRIRAGAAGQSGSFLDNLQNSNWWLPNLLRIFETRPGVVGGFATSLCLLLLLTVVFAEHSEVTSGNILLPPTSLSTAGGEMASVSAPALMATANTSGGIVASTNPVTSLQPVTTMFGQPAGTSLFQSAGFMPVNQ